MKCEPHRLVEIELSVVPHVDEPLLDFRLDILHRPFPN